MISWQQFIENLITTKRNIDSSQIQTIYGKANIAVELAKMYNPDLLSQVSVIANLASGAYGIYNTGEDNDQTGDTIHVNVRRILNEKKTDVEAILEIASTIIHEATHDAEYAQTGRSDETGPKRTEENFMNWVKQNWNTIIQKFPEINQASPYFLQKQKSLLPQSL